MPNKIFPAIIVGTMLLISLLLYPSLPDQIPVHWNIQGTPDTMANKTVAVLLLPGFTVTLLIIAHWSITTTAFQRHYNDITPTTQFIVNAVLSFLAFTHALMLVTAINTELLHVRLFVIGLGVLFAMLGNVLGRLRPNPMFGFRFPWTSSDEVIWRRTHRVGARWLFISGLVMILAALTLTPELIFLVTMGLLLGGSVCLIGCSHDLWLERHSKEL